MTDTASAPADLPETMRALRLTAVESPLEMVQLPVPQPAEGEVLIQLKAAALNHRDLWIQQGKYPGVEPPVTLGSDGAGVVAAVGEGVPENSLGRPVLINPSLNWGDNPWHQSPDFNILGLPDDGTFAEFVCVPAENVHRVPDKLSWQQAAALPLAGLTAWRALFGRAALGEGERLLITGIGGGVAHYGLQFALAKGAEVWVTSSSQAKLDAAMERGAAGGVLYTEADWAKRLAEQAGDFDVILDSAGGEGFGELVRLAGFGGRIAFFGATRGKWPAILPQPLFYKQVSILGSTMGAPGEFSAMVSFTAMKDIQPVVDRVFPLREGQQALDYMAAGQQSGKIVLEMDAS